VHGTYIQIRCWYIWI